MNDNLIYKKGRGNLACTIFVPFDCANHCPFCTSKEMYGKLAKKQAFNLPKIIEVIKQVNKHADITEFVLTGGEPFANLASLKEIINACEKKVYINTTLPMVSNIDEVIDYINREKKIKGLNISRHIGFNFKAVADIAMLDKIKKSIRINTVINNNFTFEKLEDFIREYGNKHRIINLRADYRKINPMTLKNRDNVDDYFLEHYDFLGSTSCMVCNSEMFQINEDILLSYHRGLMFSSFVCGDKCYVNDVIVTPDGNVHHDWNFEVEESEEFFKWLYEPSRIVVDSNDTETIRQLLEKAKAKQTVYV